MKDSFTAEEVIDLLTKERLRGMDSAKYFGDKAATTARHTGIDIVKLVRKEVAEECRLIHNSISGINALHPSSFTVRDKVMEDYKEELEN